MTPQVSVIIPAYNAMSYIQETLDSVFGQTWRDYEVIIVDDGSEDHLQAWSQTLNDDRVRVIHQEHQGLAQARNTGIYHARGQYLAFLDADDLWVASKLEDQVHLIAQNAKVGLVYSWVEFINAQGNGTGRVLASHARGNIWEQLILEDFIGCGSNALVKRDCFEQCGFFDIALQSYVEDWDLWLRIAQKYEFDVIPKSQVLYRQHENSTSRNWEAMERSFLQVIAKNFTNAPLHVQSLKHQSLGSVYLCLAWQSLHSKHQDLQQAIKFQQQARQFNPQLCLTKEYLRLTSALILMKFLGPDHFKRVVKIFHLVRFWGTMVFGLSAFRNAQNISLAI
jgi:glycosyltransferase involved in cell wall biosynthesis